MEMSEAHSVVTEVRKRSGQRETELRSIVKLSAIGLIDFIPISLYQLGIIRHLPDPPGPIFNSDKINGSREAQVGGVPDGVVSLLLYAGTMTLAAAALSRVLPVRTSNLLLGGTLIGQALGGTYYLHNMIRVQKKICPYCVTGALINFAALIPLSRLFKSKQRR